MDFDPCFCGLCYSHVDLTLLCGPVELTSVSSVLYLYILLCGPVELTSMSSVLYLYILLCGPVKLISMSSVLFLFLKEICVDLFLFLEGAVWIYFCQCEIEAA